MEKLFENAQTLAMFLFFFLPGFVSLKVYDALTPSERRDFSKSVYEVIAYSTLNNALLYPLALWLWSRNPTALSFVTWAGGALVLVAFPVLWPFLWLGLLKTKLFSRYFVHPTQKPWDFVFGQRKPYWMIVHSKNLGRVAGLYGRRSFASSNPAPPQIYLEELWELDETGQFLRPIEESEGILILEDEILAVEFFRYSSG